MPSRIQRQRIAGWRMPEGAVYVGRPTKWGNPFVYHNRTRGLVRYGPKHLERLPWVDRGMTAFPGYWTDKAALAMEHSTDEWLEAVNE